MSSHDHPPLMSDKSCDEDTDLVDSEQSEPEDDETYNLSHTPNDHDRQVLLEAEDEEHLVRHPRQFDVGTGPAQTRTYRTKRIYAQQDKKARQKVGSRRDAGAIYEMEGGYKDNSSRSSSESIALANEKWNNEPSVGTPLLMWALLTFKLGKSRWRLLSIGLGITTMFLLLTYGSYTASRKRMTLQTLSNGTHPFAPTTVLISLDGFRADFLQHGLTPAMNAFVQSGVSPKYMLPSFPSLTFPNHFTLVTGLYPESHGIVSNQFWDPNLKEEFYYTNVSNSMRPKWWNAEPIWVTAEKAGLKSAVHMWPGSEAHIGNMDPTYLDKYNGSEALDVKVDRILHWLDMPEEERPRFIAAYVPNVDSDGHEYGPNSTEIRATIVEVDSMLTGLIAGLYTRNLTEVVNLVIVSDHGMATTSDDRLIQLDDIIDLSLIDHIDGWPLRGLRLKNPEKDLPVLHQQLLAASEGQGFDVYTPQTMPERYHFSNNDRIAPLWVVPQTGWAIVEKVDFDVVEAQSTGKKYHPKGLHGYDHEHPLMRAIFIARGPAFPHTPNSRVNAFQNIEVYNIVCDSLAIAPHPNNGTLRLPLNTIGLHSDYDEPLDIPLDPVIETAALKAISTASETQSTTISNLSSIPTSTASPSKQVTSSTTNKKSGKSWWDFLHNQLEKAKEWAKEIIDSIRSNSKESGTVIPE